MWWFAVIFAVLATALGLTAVAMENSQWQAHTYIAFAFTMAMFMICLVFGALKERGRIINQAADTGVQQRHTGHA